MTESTFDVVIAGLVVLLALASPVVGVLFGRYFGSYSVAAMVPLVLVSLIGAAWYYATK